MGGICPNGWRVVFCLVSRSYWEPMWHIGETNDWKLPALNADPNTWTVAGGSAGGLMTSNIHTAYSDKFKGAGIVIGTCYADYYDLWDKTQNNAELSFKKSQKYDDWGFIDPVENLKDMPVFIFSGGEDTVVPPIKQTSVKDYYDLHQAQPVLEYQANVGHEWPSIFWPPWMTWKPQTYDLYGNMIKHLLENLKEGARSVSLLSSSNMYNYRNCGVLRKFSQIEFSEAYMFTSENIDHYGWVWIPNQCLTQQCRVHLEFHGSTGAVSDISQQGFNEIVGKGSLQYGCSLDMIVIYPQSRVGLFNPRNTWGQDGHLHFKIHEVLGFLGVREPLFEQLSTKDAIQFRAIVKMMERVTQPKDDSKYTYADNDQINYLKMSQDQKKELQASINKNHFFELAWQLWNQQKWEKLWNIWDLMTPEKIDYRI